MFLLRRSFRRRLLIFVLSALACVARAGEVASPLPTAKPRYTGAPFMHSWLAGDYGASPENFCAVQDPRTGFMYVGNFNGLLEFDGERWRLITEPGASLVRSLCVDHRGRIWGCGLSTVFRLEPDARGELRAMSMEARIPAEARAQGPVFRVVASPSGVYACGPRYLMIFGDEGGPAQAWPVGEGTAAALNLWQIGDEPYVQLGAPANVVIRRRGDRWEHVPGLTSAVFAARTESDGTWQLATAQGIQRWNGLEISKAARPIGNEDALQSIFLPDGRIVLATVNRGLVVTDREGRVVQTVGRLQGLPANQVRGLAADREGGVWAALPYGIARVQLDSPYARHGSVQGVEGTVNSLVRYHGELVAGGSEGVARRGVDGLFRVWPGLPGPVRGLVSHDGWLFSAGTQLRGAQPVPSDARVLEEVDSYALLPLVGAPGWYAYGSSEGLRWAHFVGGKWISEGPLKTITGVPTALLEAPAGVVWACIDSDGSAWRIDFRGGLSVKAPARKFGINDGLPAGNGSITMLQLGGEPVALANGRLRRFDEGAGRFAPEARVAGLEGFPIERMHVSSDGTVWLQGGEPAHEIRRIVPEAADSAAVARWRAEALPGEPLRHLLPSALFHDPTTQTLWIAGYGDLVSYDLSWRRTRPAAPPVTQLRRIETAAGQLLVAVNSSTPTAQPVAFEPEQDNLRISYAVPAFAPDHEGVVHLQYRTRLDGLDHEWNAWSDEAERHLTNLPWRAFTFRVQARDDAGRIGPEALFAFSIRPAWWATRWAWAAYGVLGLVGLTGVVRLRTRALRQRSQRLEAIVRERTRELAHSNAELAASNTELARLHRLELDEKIAAQLSEEKARLEVLRYQLNPHFLYNSLNSIYGLLFENARDAGEMVLRLSDFCRAALTGATDELPTVAAAIAMLRTYLDVEQVRWGEKLLVEFAVAPELAQVRLPPFLLLPLVENAIKYGSRTSPGILRLSIRVFSAEQKTNGAGDPAPRAMVIEIANTGEWLPPDPSRAGSTGIGLENLRQRLQRYYPGAHEFTTETKDDWVVVRLSLNVSLSALSQSSSPSLTQTLTKQKG